MDEAGLKLNLFRMLSMDLMLWIEFVNKVDPPKGTTFFQEYESWMVASEKRTQGVHELFFFIGLVQKQPGLNKVCALWH